MNISDQDQITKSPCLMMQGETDAAADRVTIIAPSYYQAALEFHRRRMAEKGYRLAYRIEKQQLFVTDGTALTPLFDGRTMYLANFIRHEEA